jgi:hypothetical protein
MLVTALYKRYVTVKTDDGQITTYDRIRQMLDRNYEKSVKNTMRKYNKKVSKSNAKIEKGSCMFPCIYIFCLQEKNWLVLQQHAEKFLLFSNACQKFYITDIIT